MLDAKRMGTPLANHFKHQLSITCCPLDATEKWLMSKVPYESAFGSLMYLMVCTRLDIAYALGKVSKYMANPWKVHWEAMKWILRYIKGTIGYGLLFDAHSHQAKTLVGYHFIMQVVFEEKVKLQKIAGTLNTTDGFTKYIALESFSTHCANLQICQWTKKRVDKR
ncbi:hypothetical protein R1flu_026837 [Riccia fluitans]|uniref:Retrovirus-related Pol polyprotein from transposon TNT 1-94 n=1 Tax=Riccia fluitans TaxID=41844 RepID=A0ABD1XHN9_9MARC